MADEGSPEQKSQAATGIAHHLSSLIDEVSEQNIIEVEAETDFRYTVYLSWEGTQGDEGRPRGIDRFDLKDVEKDFEVRFIGACVRETPWGRQPCLAVTVDVPVAMYTSR